MTNNDLTPMEAFAAAKENPGRRYTFSGDVITYQDEDREIGFFGCWTVTAYEGSDLERSVVIHDQDMWEEEDQQ